MCGIAGFFNPKIDQSEESVAQILNAMSTAIIHRGPDGHGNWIDAESGIGLTHRRLSIIDLTSAGHQPMVSNSSKYVISFNGEIYNHNDLRYELKNKNIKWRGHSDTETLLVCVEIWGIEETLKKITGMFAFALWDREERTLCLARDRMGEKPLYYGFQKGCFLFGSELKSLKAHPLFEKNINRNALALYFRHNYIPAPYSIYEGIKKLEPGTYLLLSKKSLSLGCNENPKSYWAFNDAVKAGIKKPFIGSDLDAIEQLEHLLQKSVNQQMMSDVPLGAFLSGGIDSSTIVALMQNNSNNPIKTFTIGFDEQNYNEAENAKAVANHLGTNHTELYISPQKAMEVIPKLPTIYDEPFSDSSQIPTFLVSDMTRSEVTVSLSGDAADELFGGYNRYFWANNIWDKIKKYPLPMRELAAKGIEKISPSIWNKIIKIFMPIIPSRFQVTLPGDKVHKFSSVLNSRTQEEIYLRLISHWPDPSKVVKNGFEPMSVLNRADYMSKVKGFEEIMMIIDSTSYLPDDILCKVDRAAMAVSLETRVPFLNHNVVEFAWSLPMHLKIRNGQGKWVLRRVLEKYVPRTLTDRPKMGFGVPIDTWLRGPIKDWAESLIESTRIKEDGFLDPKQVRKKWEEHLSGERNWQHHLWDVLMFQAWLEQQ